MSTGNAGSVATESSVLDALVGAGWRNNDLNALRAMSPENLQIIRDSVAGRNGLTLRPVVDCDIPPFCHDGLVGIRDHSKDGLKIVTNSSLGSYVWDVQQSGNGATSAQMCELMMSGTRVMNATMADFYLVHQSFLPEWFTSAKLGTKVFFWGTKFLHRQGGVAICYLSKNPKGPGLVQGLMRIDNESRPWGPLDIAAIWN